MKVKIPIFNEEEVEAVDVIVRIKEIWQMCKKLKQYYPSVRHATVKQYALDWNEKPISEQLFEKKIEVLLQQDDELRWK